MPAAITKADVVAFAPELNTIVDGVWTDILTYVNEFDLTQVAQDQFNLPSASAQTNRMAKIWLAAHMITQDKRGASAAAGPLTSESVGGVRRSYGLIPFGTAMNTLATTRYGQEFLETIGMSFGGPMLV